MVADFEDDQVTYVSCGAFHTLAVTSKGHLYSFGQNKYGKLGLHAGNSKEGDARKVPVKITMYKVGVSAEVLKSKNNIKQVIASTNHSLALSDSGKIFSWGYRGRGLLGRQPEPP
jgi:alpha-tubulin suppressor-like RCC1 family protein